MRPSPEERGPDAAEIGEELAFHLQSLKSVTTTCGGRLC